MNEEKIVSRCSTCGCVYGCKEHVNGVWKKKKCSACDARYKCVHRVVMLLEQDARDLRDCDMCLMKDRCQRKQHMFRRVCAVCPNQCMNHFSVSAIGTEHDVSHGHCSGRCSILEYPELYSAKEVADMLKEDGFSQHTADHIMRSWDCLDGICAVTGDKKHSIEMKRALILKEVGWESISQR